MRNRLVIVAAVVCVYANSLSGPLIFDDRGTILDNQTIEDLGSRAVLQPPHETSVAGRPVANVSFAVNYAIGGREAAGYHVVNIAIHALVALALFGVLRRTRLPDTAALAIALLWAVHPLNTDAVDYLTQRTECLMALFYLCTLYCAIRAHGARGPRTTWTVAAVAACALGMATKESMVTAPVILLLYDRIFVFPSWRDAVRERRPLYLGLAATWILLAALVWNGPRNLSAGFTAHDANVWNYLLNQAVMIVRYLRLALWPTDLVLYYGWPQALTLRTVLPQVTIVVALLACTAWALWRKPRLGFLGAVFFITLAPTSSIVPIATEVGAERRMYLPLIAVVVLAVFAARAVLASSRARAAALAVVTLLLGTLTILRNAEYRSSLRLAETTVERWPTPAAHSMIGTELAAAGRLADAEAHLRQAAATYPPARYYLGTVLAARGRNTEAIEAFESFIAGQPAQLEQVRLARAGLAAALLKSGREDNAVAQYRALLAADPNDDQAMVQIAQVLMKQQRYDEALVMLRQIAVARPTEAWACTAMGIAYASTNRLDEAVEAFRRAADLDPANDRARENLARAQAMRKR